MDTFDVLETLIKSTTCKPGWEFSSNNDAEGYRLVIFIPVDDSRGGRLRGVYHYFPVPRATYNMKSWRRWIFECCRKVEDHELGEWFLVDAARSRQRPLHRSRSELGRGGSNESSWCGGDA